MLGGCAVEEFHSKAPWETNSFSENGEVPAMGLRVTRAPSAGQLDVLADLDPQRGAQGEPRETSKHLFISLYKTLL